MAVYQWPAAGGKAFWPARVRWRSHPNTRGSTSPLSQYVQTTAMPGAKWGLLLEFPEQSYDERRALHGWLDQLSGQEHRASLFDVSQPTPRGSCPVSGVTVQGGAAQFATALTLAGTPAGTTLLAGDQIQVPIAGGGTQLLRIVADAVAGGGNTMAVQVRHAVRAAVAANAAVVLDRPRVLCILAESTLDVPYGHSNRCPAFGVQFVEVFA